MDPNLLRKYHSQRVPRYTSYPTSPHFQPIDEATCRRWLKKAPPSRTPRRTVPERSPRMDARTETALLQAINGLLSPEQDHELAAVLAASSAQHPS